MNFGYIVSCKTKDDTKLYCSWDNFIGGVAFFTKDITDAEIFNSKQDARKWFQNYRNRLPYIAKVDAGSFKIEELSATEVEPLSLTADYEEMERQSAEYELYKKLKEKYGA